MKNKSPVTSVFATIGLIAASIFAGPATAGEVVLFSQDGSVTIVGELVSFENNDYTVRTIFGELILNVEDVVCEGDGCPVVPEISVLINS